MSDLSMFRSALLAKQSELSRERDRDQLSADRVADDLENIQRLDERELAIRLLDKDAALLRSVRDALRRMDADEYGFCLECEEEISAKRLAAVPWASYCLQCQERNERQSREHRIEDLAEDVA